jgi:L-ascorbate metabolism protein UlaG (beta-lactamase superfamily)
MAAATIQYCGHSTVIVTTESGLRVIVDPWLDGNPSCPPNLTHPGKIDGVILTHGHGDHAGSAVALLKKSGARLFATYELAMLLQKEGVPQAQIEPMNKGGTVALGENGVAVTLTNAFHSSSFDASDGKTHYAGEPCGAVLRLESQRAIYHAGDSCFFSDMKFIGERFRPAVSLLPIGDRFTMGPEEAAEAAKLLRSPHVIPIHHSTFPLLTGTPAAFKAALRGTESKMVALKPGETFSL